MVTHHCVSVYYNMTGMLMTAVCALFHQHMSVCSVCVSIVGVHHPSLSSHRSWVLRGKQRADPLDQSVLLLSLIMKRYKNPPKLCSRLYGSFKCFRLKHEIVDVIKKAFVNSHITCTNIPEKKIGYRFINLIKYFYCCAA